MKRAPYVCVCASVRPCVNEKCYFSSISWPILILFVLSDRAWCGLQNFYTEFWNSLFMQIYSKSMKNATSLSFLGRFWFCLFYLIGLGAGFKFWNSVIMQIYANLFKINEKCYFSVISWPILILFVLSDRAWCRLLNFYTEFWNSLIMQIYANLFKINEKCYFSVISWPILILFGLSDRAWWGLQNFYTEFWNSLIMQIYAYLFKSAQQKMLLSISQRILILFGLSDRAWWGLQNFYTEFWNSLIMQVYAYLFKSNKKCYSLFHSGFWFCLFYLIGLGGGFETFTQNCEIH